jgi:hypothetical protein
MPSKTKDSRLDQKSHWQEELNRRISELTAAGASKEKIGKDAAVRRIRAEIRKSSARLTAIGRRAKQLEDMAVRRAEKAAAPKQEKKKKGKAEEEAAAAQTKRQKKKQQKKETKAPEEAA